MGRLLQQIDKPPLLTSGKVEAVFSVDLFNEGVDVPDVDTILMLRPTESPTLFLQQLGRGLRKHAAKSHCSVLDFVGLHRREFRFDRRYRALLGGSRRSLERSVQGGFPFLPAGCHMQLDEKASEIVLRSLRDASVAVAAEGRRASSLRRPMSPSIQLISSRDRAQLEDVYTAGRTWSDLQEAAGHPCFRQEVTKEPFDGQLGAFFTSMTPRELMSTGTFLVLTQCPTFVRSHCENGDLLTCSDLRLPTRLCLLAAAPPRRLN